MTDAVPPFPATTRHASALQSCLRCDVSPLCVCGGRQGKADQRYEILYWCLRTGHLEDVSHFANNNRGYFPEEVREVLAALNEVDKVSELARNMDSATLNGSQTALRRLGASMRLMALY